MNWCAARTSWARRWRASPRFWRRRTGPEVFNGYCGAESGSVPVSAISPAILVSGIEIEKRSKSQDRPPLLPMPASDSGGGAVKRRAALVTILALAACALPAASPDDDVILRAMRDELARSRGMRLVNLEPPYFISYSLDDGETFTVAATLGGIVSSRRERFRLPEVEVRVGDYKFDNTNYAGGGMFGSRFDVSRFPLENDYGVMRRYLWLSTDGAYKAAVEAIARKRAALQNMAVSDQLEDFARAEPVQRVLDFERPKIDEAPWQAVARSLSALFGGYPKIKDSSVEMNVTQSVHYQVNSEGTELRYPDRVAFVRLRAIAQSADGMSLHDAVVFHSHDANRIAPEPEMRRAAQALAENLTKLAEAPVGEDYNGPILFEGVAASAVAGRSAGEEPVAAAAARGRARAGTDSFNRANWRAARARASCPSS